MRILQVNKFWYPRGGDCVVAMATARLLRRMGHEVGVFTMQHPLNTADPHIVGLAPAVDFAGSPADKLRYLRRVMGDSATRKAFTQALHDFDPQVVHLHNVHSYLSPIVAQLAHEHGCRVVWTMHDYKLICPTYSCLRDGSPCTACLDHALDVVNHRCMKHSLPASIAALLEATKWNRQRILPWVDAFVCPSEFMARQLSAADIPASKIRVIHNFMPAERLGQSPVAQGRADYCCYVGRLSPEKGVDTLLQAAACLPITLKVAGDGPLAAQLSEQYASSKNIKFLGHQDAATVTALLQHARFSVVPSQWWENNPLSIIESFCAGTPVVATRMGGIPELADDSCALLVPPSDADALAGAMQQAWSRRWDHAAIARRACSLFGEQQYYRQLLAAYSSSHQPPA